MARRASETLTPREAQVMAVLWKLRRATAEQVRDALAFDPHDSTVRTVLRVLESKGCVKHSPRGKAFVYRPAVDRGMVERKALRSILDLFFGGSARALVLRLMEDERLTADELRSLRALARKEPGKARRRKPQ